MHLKSVKRVKRRFKKTLKHISIYFGSRKNREVGDLDVVICSPGGVATTMLLEHIGCFLRTNDKDDRDTLKHVPDPELLLSDEKFRGQVIYVSGDLSSIVASIERRGWIRIQGAKLGSLSSVLLPESAAKKAFTQAVSGQVNAFTKCSDHRLMRMSFEEIWDNTERLSYFLGIEDPSFSTDFPQRKQRQSEHPVARAQGKERQDQTQ